MNNKPTDFTVPTFKAEEDDEDATATREVDVTRLTEASIKQLQRQDPFMYYSIVAPSGTTLRQNVQNAVVESVAAQVQGLEADDGHQPGVMVQHHTCVSNESDHVTLFVQQGGLNTNNTANNINDEDDDEDAEDEREDENEDDEGESKDADPEDLAWQ
jgi:phosphopantothenoylcysteine synthetase/decarboxylase